MTPETLALTARANVPFLEEYEFTDDGVAYDMTGCTAAMQVRQYGGAASTVISLSNVASNIEGVWISDPSGGVLQVKIDAATLGAAYADYFGDNEAGTSIEFKYDLVLTWNDGFEETLLEGELTLKPGVTV